jgi:tryptophan-rich sensory protein
MRSPARFVVSFAISFAITFAAAALGALASRDAANFYAALSLPAWAPPAGVFGPVWGVLYLMMAIALWRAWVAAPEGRRAAPVGLYLVQLAANTLWSWLFFAWHRGGAALADIVVLWLLIVATIVVYRRYDRWAAWLLVPYLAWVSFATALNYAVWQANPTLLGG